MTGSTTDELLTVAMLAIDTLDELYRAQGLTDRLGLTSMAIAAIEELSVMQATMVNTNARRSGSYPERTQLRSQVVGRPVRNSGLAELVNGQ